ncbi:MAG: nucleotidyltransferase domain-containing protein [Flavisolibacter sp.]
MATILTDLPFLFQITRSNLCVKQDILATLSYFDIFDYPLFQTEIFQFLRHSYPQKEFTEALQELCNENWIYKLDEYYSLQDNYSLVIRRKEGNSRAKNMLKTAEKIAAFLSRFPFVRGVAVSGSLSKNFADKDSDIDFFIITAKNRLWLARTFMHCFKKITFLVKKQEWFCMNYYIDEEAMQIKEKNLFTATEVATLLPLRGIDSFQQFYVNNKWSRNYLPNHVLRVSYVDELKKPFFKKLVELIFNNPLGNVLDISLMKLTRRRWALKKKQRRLNKRGFVLGMDVSRHYAKPDPESFQKKLVETYEKKIFNLFLRYESRAKSIY